LHKDKLTNKRINIILATTASISLLLLLFWLFNDPTKDFVINNPGMDKLNMKAQLASTENIVIGEHFARVSTYTSTLTGQWPIFRGANHDNIVKTNYPVNVNWKVKVPKISWSIPTGEGHASPVIYNGLVYFIDYNEKEKADVLKCLSLETGKELWRRWYNIHIKRNHGMSRTIPAVNEKYVVTMGPRCHVMCTDRLTGDLYWGIDLEKKYKTKTPLWYTGQCPIIVNDVAILAVGGSSLMIGVDCKTGTVLWETPNTKKWEMSHSSILPVTILNKKMFVYASIGGICGVSAEQADMGKILWEITDWAPSVVAPSPVYLGNNQLFLTAGYGAGGAIIQLAENNGTFSAKTVSKFSPQEGLASEQQTPILNNGFIYGILPKDAGSNRNQFVCYKTSNLKTPVWQSGKANRFGLGPYIQINDVFLILNDEGTLSMIEASGKSYKQLNQKKLFEGADAWGPMAFADGYLLLRDSKTIYCLDLKP